MKAPSLYLYYQIKIAQKCDDAERREIPFGQIYNMFRSYKVPKRLYKVVLKEMEALELVKLEEDSVKVINCKHYDSDDKKMTRMWRRKRQVEDMLSGKGGFFDF